MHATPIHSKRDSKISQFMPTYSWLSLLCVLAFPLKATSTNCPGPVILVNAKTIVLSNSSISAKLIYRDIANRITDSCDGDLTFAGGKVVMERILPDDPITPTAPRTLTPNGTTTGLIGNAGLLDGSGNPLTDGLTFYCFDWRQNIRVWAKNDAGNWRFGIATITVQDIDGVCRTIDPLLSGTIGTEAGAPVKDVVVTATANGVIAGTTTTVIAGTFSITGVSTGINYQFRAAKPVSSDNRNGVTTLDIALISKHLLGTQLLDSPYKIIAADVNQDGEVDALDLLILRRFLLNITQTLPTGTSWRFIDRTFIFRDPTQPLDENFPEFINYSLFYFSRGVNFIAVKLGDVNNSFDATTIR
jgi:Dockerin type I domain